MVFGIVATVDHVPIHPFDFQLQGMRKLGRLFDGCGMSLQDTIFSGATAAHILIVLISKLSS
jgi:hypothetical protein